MRPAGRTHWEVKVLYTGVLGDTPQRPMLISVQDLPAKTTERIAKLTKPKENQELEVLGFKGPAAQVTPWGSLTLLGIQFYFWLHLHEFGGKVARTSPGSDVA